MSSIREKMIASIQGRSQSPLTRAPRPEGQSETPPTSADTHKRMSRMPSSDALNRSSHNAIAQDDGSELSKDRIIASLKKANAALTSKTAEMEATFMNQCNVLAAEISARTKVIEEREKENMALKAKVASHESQLKEGVKIISTLEGEKQFQKQTITDLKNQLFQMQNDIEDSEYDKSQELTTHKERTREAEKRVQELEKERSVLINKVDSACMERDRAKTELLQLMKGMDDRDASNSAPSIEISIHDNQVISESSLPSPTDTSEVRQNWRQLEEKKEQLESTLTLLHETQSSLATLEHKHKNLQRKFDQSLEAQTNEVKRAAQEQSDELKSALRSKEEIIANLHQRLEHYNDDLTKAEDEIDRINAEIDSARVGDLKVALEEAQKLLEEEKQLTSELTRKYDELTKTVERLEKETDSLRINSVDEIIEEKDEQIKSLCDQVSIFRNKLSEEKKQTEMLINIKASKISQLEDDLKKAKTDPERRISQLEQENKVLHAELESMEKELNDAIQAHNEMEEEMQMKLARKDEELRLSQSNEYEDLAHNFDMSTNSIGLVNDEVVTRLKSSLTDMEEDRASLKQQLEIELASRDAKIVELQKEIDMQKQQISSIEDSHGAEVAKLVKEIETELATAEKDQALVEEKNNEIQRLENAVKKVNLLLDEKEKEMELLRVTKKKDQSYEEEKNNEIQRLESTIKEVNLLLDEKDKTIEFLRDSNEIDQSLAQEKDNEIQRLKSAVKEVNLLLDKKEKEAEERIKSFLVQKEDEIRKIKDAAEIMKSYGVQHEEEIESMRNIEKEMKSRLEKQSAEMEQMKLSKEEMKALLEERENKIRQMDVLLEKKENQADRLELDIARVKAGAEQKELDMRQDIEVREDAWKEEKRQLVEEKRDLSNKLDDALKEKEHLLEERNIVMDKLELLKETTSKKEVLDDSMKSREARWKKEKQQLLDEKDDLMTRLDKALKRSASQKDQINELELKIDDCEERLETYTKDLAVLDDLKDQLDHKQEELDEMKEQNLLEKKNHQKTVASLRNDGKKRSDKLKIIELNEELEKLRTELRKANKDKVVGIADTAKQEAVKKAYSMAKDTHHRKELSDLEEKLKKEIDELKSKLSDRDTTITATLRSSVLKEQKMNLLKEQIKALQERNDHCVDTLSVSSNNYPFEELQNLRESVHNHEETRKSLSNQIRSLKKQLADAKLKYSSKKRGGSSTEMEKQLDEYKTKIRERDGAIQTLVKSSITQEQQISSLRDELADLKATQTHRSEPKNSDRPSWEEMERLQQESEIFAGQIIEQDEEIEDLRRLLEDAQYHVDHNESLRTMVQDLQKQLAEQLELNEERLTKRTMSHTMKLEMEEELLIKDNENERSKRMMKTIKSELEEEKAKNNELRMDLADEKKKRENLELEVKLKTGKFDEKDSRLTKINDELDQVEETNQKLQYEIRELRRKLRNARLEADRASDLELELSETKRILSDMKWKRSGNHLDDNDKKLAEAIAQRDALETQTRGMSKDLLKLKEDCEKAEDKCRKLEEEMTVCRQERDGAIAEFLAKETKMKEVEETLRQELRNTFQTRENLEAKIKELKENESRLRNEIEVQKNLCSQKEAATSKAIQEADMHRGAIAELQRDSDDQNDLIQSLTTEVKNLRSSNMKMMDTESTELIAALSAEIKKLRHENLSKENSQESSDIIAALTDEVKKLRNNQTKSDSDVIKALTLEVQTLHAALREQRGQNDAAEIERVVRGEIEQEIQSIRSQKDFLGNENMNLRSKLEALESDRQKISTFKKQADEAEKGRTLFEKTMISTYERKLNLMQMNKDLTIDGLRKELAQSRESLKEIESDLLDKIKSLEMEKNELEMELKAKMQHKNAKIQFMEQTLSAQEQLVNHMKDELDQLQNGMENVSVTRRAELEEMQEDLMSVQTKATRYEREITALKMQLEDQKVQHRNELANLQYRMEEMEIENDESPTIRQQAEKDRMALQNLARQVDSLKNKVGSLQEENFDLREKLNKGIGDSRTSKNDKWRNSALQEQVISLTKRLKELEGDDSSVRSSSSRRSLRSKKNKSESSRRMPPTPRGMASFSSRRSNHGSIGDDISTYTEETF